MYVVRVFARLCRLQSTLEIYFFLIREFLTILYIFNQLFRSSKNEKNKTIAQISLSFSCILSIVFFIFRMLVVFFGIFIGFYQIVFKKEENLGRKIFG
jgi:hypothetical protein